MKQTQQHNNKAQNKVNISFANEWRKTNGFFISILQISGTLLCYVYVYVFAWFFFLSFFILCFCYKNT